MRKSSITRRAFTLIELLTVISIIGVLVALLFPAIKSAMTKAEASKAQTAISGLATAFQHYYTEYGHYPVAELIPANSNTTYCVDTNFVALLLGANNGATLTGSTGAGGPAGFGLISTSFLQGNPRGIRFLEFKQADLDPVKGYIDPWKQPYYCRFDMGYYSDVNNPFTGGGSATLTKVNAGFIIWSAGQDAQFDNTGDLPPSTVNKDNVKSW